VSFDVCFLPEFSDGLAKDGGGGVGVIASPILVFPPVKHDVGGGEVSAF